MHGSAFGTERTFFKLIFNGFTKLTTCARGDDSDLKMINLYAFLGPSEKWLMGLRERHPIISLRKPEGLTSAAANVTSRNISIWFDNLIKYLEEENVLQHLMDRPQNILNLDESGIDLNAMPRKVFTTRNVKHTYLTESAKHRTRISVTMCVAADGSILPTQFIFPNTFSRMLDAAHAAGGKIVLSYIQKISQLNPFLYHFLQIIERIFKLTVFLKYFLQERMQTFNGHRQQMGGKIRNRIGHI